MELESSNDNDPASTTTRNNNRNLRTNNSERAGWNRGSTNNNMSGSGRHERKRQTQDSERTANLTNSRITNVFVIEGEDDDHYQADTNNNASTNHLGQNENSTRNNGRTNGGNNRRRKNRTSTSKSAASSRNERSSQSVTIANTAESRNSNRHRSNRNHRRTTPRSENRNAQTTPEQGTTNIVASVSGTQDATISHQNVVLDVTSIQPVQVLVSKCTPKKTAAHGHRVVDEINSTKQSTTTMSNTNDYPKTSTAKTDSSLTGLISDPFVHSIDIIDESDTGYLHFGKYFDELHSDEEFIDFITAAGILEANIDDSDDSVRIDDDNFGKPQKDATRTTVSPSFETTDIGVTMSITSDHSNSDATTADLLLMDVVNSTANEDQVQLLSFVDCFITAAVSAIGSRSNDDVFSSNDEVTDNNQSQHNFHQAPVSTTTTGQNSIESIVQSPVARSQLKPSGSEKSNPTATRPNTAETTTKSKKSKAKKSTSAPPSNQSTEEMNMERCQQIMQYQTTISTLKKDVIKLQQEHSKIQLLASLACPKRSHTVWNSLQKQEKWKKLHVLTLLRSFRIDEKDNLTDIPGSSHCARVDIDMIEDRHKHYLPNLFKESNWEQSVPSKIKNDKEIFLSRIATYHFRYHYSINCQKTLSLIEGYYTKMYGLASDTTSPASKPGRTSGKAQRTKVSSKIVKQLEKSQIAGIVSNESNKTKKNNHNNSQNKQPVLEWSDEQQARLPSSFVIPKPFWNDPEVMQSIVYHFPEILLCLTSPHLPEASPNSVPNATIDSQTNSKTNKSTYCIWNDGIVLQQFIRSPYVCRTKLLKKIMPSLIEKFHPISIRQNKNLMLSAINNLSWNCFQYVHPSLLDDKTFVLKVFQLHRGPYSEFESCGPRQSVDIESTKECCRLMPSSLLSNCSATLRKDIDVVLAAVAQNGLALQYASSPLRRHYRVIMQACTNDPIAFIHAPPSDARSKLQGNKDFWLHIIFKKLESECQVVHGADKPRTEEALFGHRLRSNDTNESSRQQDETVPVFKLSTLWALVPGVLKKNESIIKAAIKAGCLHIDEVPPYLRDNETFWMEMLRYDSNFWYNLPPKFQKDVKFVVEGIRKFGSQELVAQIFHRFENLRSNRSIWERIISSIELRSENDDDGLLDFHSHIHVGNPFVAMGIFAAMFDVGLSSSSLQDLIVAAPSVILENKELMIEACKRESNVYLFLRFPLSDDRDIIQATLNRTPQAIKLVRPDLQRLYPQLIADAIKALPTSDLWDYYAYIDEDLWSECREVALAWVSSGGDYLHDEFPVEYEHDAEIFLHVAKHNPHDFWCAAESLCNNKEYMKKVVGINGELLHEAWSGLSRDYDLTTIALASTPDLPNRYDITDPEDFNFITSVAKHIRTKIQEVTVFQNLILCSISLGSNDESVGSCRLPLLDQGNETALVYKKLIFDYIGLPTGNDLRTLRKASANLAVWGY